uniref:Uncharacterized protein n=1 Tax=Anas platyrhynchos TaxID=8839 RepID=A0A8B9TMQ5_ANAPL
LSGCQLLKTLHSQAEMLVLLVALLAGGFARVEYPFFFFFLSERKSICSVCAAGLACSVRSSVQAQGTCAALCPSASQGCFEITSLHRFPSNAAMD